MEREGFGNLVHLFVSYFFRVFTSNIKVAVDSLQVIERHDTGLSSDNNNRLYTGSALRGVHSWYYSTMETLTIIMTIAQVIGISLGLGSSTLAVASFFKAITDGTIDPSERGMLGVIYIVLRVAMMTILISTVALAFIGYGTMGTAHFTTYVIAQFVLTAALFLNATLMTMRIMPSTFGPAIQAGSWYLLAFGMALSYVGLASFSLSTFILAYAIELVFAFLVINGIMRHLKSRQSV